MDDDRAQGATFFLQRAREAVEAADTARNLDAAAAFYQEAETWLYMAAQCLGRTPAEAPPTLSRPDVRVRGEPRSFDDR